MRSPTRFGSGTTAEHLATLGVTPDGRLSTIAGSAPFPSPTTGWHRDSDAVSAMQGRLEEVAGRIKVRAAVIEDDPITQGILLEISGGLAKHAWMIRVSGR
jgi:starvation-inducible DNA-binding protein